ncbi:hypothetical protein [Xenorhabdus szentirmaii]|uniref:Phage protein n=1 Tax=Xenorhabdus szentirmaii TaxID=290112 RepID=A0AAW3YMJ2_9GAMM|nr:MULTISPECIES: hypothetical protein [Xenorhabdus]MBD2780672.1 hypothetical protein [Xenorhabdus sp. 38]MBD2799237.1 hypothetical protein [Xenorhabdus sp. M]PHM40534.1 hypothetical protein Xszus_00194 [Xenorhabdus szentirmaii]
MNNKLLTNGSYIHGGRLVTPENINLELRPEKLSVGSDDYLIVPRSTVLKKELEEIELRQNALKAEWQKKFDLLDLVYELEAHLLTETQA